MVDAHLAEVKNTDDDRSKLATKKTVKAPKEKKPRSKAVPTHPPYLEVCSISFCLRRPFCFLLSLVPLVFHYVSIASLCNSYVWIV